MTNISDLHSDLKEHVQEEADIRIALHAIDVCKRDKHIELTTSSSDTNVLLIFLNYFDQLPSATTYKHKTTHNRYDLRSVYEKFKPRVCTALLGFHAMNGNDQTGKFNGFTKKTCWDTFVQSTADILDTFIHLGTTDMSHETDFKSLESIITTWQGRPIRT